MLKDGVFLLIAKFLSIFSGMIVSMFVARYYGVSAYGSYTTAVAFATFILTFTDLGSDTYLLKESSRNNENLNKYLGNVINLKIVMILISLVFMFGLASIMRYESIVIDLMFILIPNLIITYIVNTFFVIMQIKGLLHKNAYIQFYQNLLRILSVCLVYIFNLNIYWYAGTQSIIAIITILMYLPYVQIKTKFTCKYSKILIRGSLLFGLSSLLYIVYYKIDVVMLSFMKGAYEVGIYESAYKVVSIIIGLIVILDNIFMPKFFQLYKSNKKKMLQMYKKLFKYAIILGAPISTILVYMAPNIINILYGKEYQEAIIILQILVWSIIIRLLAAIVGFIITASDNMKKKVEFQVYFTIVNLLLNAILIPRFSIKGAAVATIITELMVFLLYYKFVSNNFIKINITGVLFKTICSNIIIAIIMTKFYKYNIFIVTVVAFLSYLIVNSVLFYKELMNLKLKINISKHTK